MATNLITKRKRFKPMGVAGIFLLIWIGLSDCSEKISPEKITLLKTTYQEGEYFRLRSLTETIFSSTNTDVLYYKAMVKNIFNEPEVSNSYLNKILNKEEISDSLAADALVLKINNLVRLGNYQEAYISAARLISEFSQATDSIVLKDQENQLLIWKALSNTVPQKVHATGNTIVPMDRDKAGLRRIPVQIGDKVSPFVFDSGANISVMQRSAAKKNHLEIIDTNFEVESFTGIKVQSDIAVAKKIIIGNHIFENVAFMVFDDDVLSFPQIDYSIEGIIGFPVIEAMKEIRIHSANHTLEIPEKPTSYNLHNLGLSGLSPFIQVHHQSHPMICFLDTGALQTSFFKPFYDLKKEEIIQKQIELQEFEEGSAGGSITRTGYVVPEINLNVGNKNVVLNNAQVYLEPMNVGGNWYANIGQDLINQFDTMIINFDSMSMILE